MTEQFYRVVIPNEQYKYIQPFQVSILIVNAVSLALVAYYQGDSIQYIWPLLLLLSTFIILYQKKLARFAFFRKVNFAETGFLWAITGWIFLGHLWVASAVAAIALLKGAVKKNFEFVLREKEIHLRIFPQQRIMWSDLQNVVLKDGVLTVDFKSNKIIQSEILPFESNISDEAEFNEFCRSRLAANS